MWRLPVREKAELSELELLHRRKYGITRYRVTLHVHAGHPGHPAVMAAGGDEWIDLEAVDLLVIPPADRAALTAVLGNAEEIA
jgi:hypothetical protein